MRKNIMETLRFSRVAPGGPGVTKAFSSDAGYDLYSSKSHKIPPMGQVTVNTNVKLILPNGTYGRIAEKSGLAQKGINIGGGVIDGGYRGEIMIIVRNLSQDTIHINSHQKICQLILECYKNSNLEEIENIQVDTDRGENGFGSTGV